MRPIIGSSRSGEEAGHISGRDRRIVDDDAGSFRACLGGGGPDIVERGGGEAGDGRDIIEECGKTGRHDLEKLPLGIVGQSPVDGAAPMARQDALACEKAGCRKSRYAQRAAREAAPSAPDGARPSRHRRRRPLSSAHSCPRAGRRQGLQCVDAGNNGIGKALPAAIGVGAGLPHLDRKHAVPKQHALARQMLEIAVAQALDPEVALQLLEDIDEGWEVAGRQAAPRKQRPCAWPGP